MRIPAPPSSKPKPVALPSGAARLHRRKLKGRGSEICDTCGERVREVYLDGIGTYCMNCAEGMGMV